MNNPNIDYIKELAGGDAAFEEKFIAILKDEFPQEREQYEAECREKNATATASIVHKIKHKFNILAMEDAYALAVAYEQELLNHRFDKDSDFRTFLDKVTNYLKTL
ncbi:Hpt domain-containing protein [Maribacter sp. 2307ULW6-5]|uniref:Hpt domain-containing protein n=1 Tax=Maribacter sp. 2307ULW6-5 TaxID=3386275 RepID=UPI0039BD5C2F